MKSCSILKNFAILAIFFSPCLVSYRVTNRTESSIFDGYNLFANNSTTTTTTTTATPDEFDDFFDSIDATEPPTLEDKINNFASTIEEAHDLATELKNELTDNSNDKEAEMLAVELQGLTGTLSSMIESNQLPVLLKTAAKLLASMRTCQDLANIGVTESGTYQLDPDGPDSIAEPIMIFCDFTTNVTEIVHDKTSEVKIENCPDGGNGCHVTQLNYDAPMDQIRALIAASETCEQSIRFDCFLAPLMVYGSDHMGFWRDYNGTERTFFHGNLDPEQPHVCQCGKLLSFNTLQLDFIFIFIFQE